MQTQVLLFKSNIKDQADREKVSAFLSDFPSIIRWNVDQDDVDNVLRVESAMLNVPDVVNLIALANYYCEELPD